MHHLAALIRPFFAVLQFDLNVILSLCLMLVAFTHCFLKWCLLQPGADSTIYAESCSENEMLSIKTWVALGVVTVFCWPLIYLLVQVLFAPLWFTPYALLTVDQCQLSGVPSAALFNCDTHAGISDFRYRSLATTAGS